MKNILTKIATIAATSAALSVAILVDFPKLVTSPASAQTLGRLEVPLDAVRESIRIRETNAGDLVADALLSVGLASTNNRVSLINGGGIRGGTFSPGDFTQTQLETLLPFVNQVVQFPAISASVFEGVLENSVANVPDPNTGRFGQISGFRFTFDPAMPAGERVISAVLDNGTPIIANGSVVSGAPDISLVTVDFLATGGDNYSFGNQPFNSLGVNSRQAVANYIQGNLGGVITASAYPEGGNGRIQAVPEPGSVLGLLALGAIGAGSRLKKKRASSEKAALATNKIL